MKGKDGSWRVWVWNLGKVVRGSWSLQGLG